MPAEFCVVRGFLLFERSYTYPKVANGLFREDFSMLFLVFNMIMNLVSGVVDPARFDPTHGLQNNTADK